MVSGSMSNTRNFNFGIGWLGSDTCGRDTAPTFHHLSAAVLGAVRVAASMSRLGLDIQRVENAKEREEEAVSNLGLQTDCP